ncbi:MAG TPA: hypothetical protein VKD47_08610 [Miltoncostaeaceae bacterium]|nr:hypothetical protein [Miltoncostaeaceae bacterium]
MNALTREQKVYIAIAGLVLFIISLFLKWTGVDVGPLSISNNGTDIDSWFLALIIAIAAGVVLLADVVNMNLPPQLSSSGLAAILCGLVGFWAVIHLIDLSNLKYGAWLGFIGGLVATIFAVMVWREDNA